MLGHRRARLEAIRRITHSTFSSCVTADMTSFMSVNSISAPQDRAMDGTSTPTRPHSNPTENAMPPNPPVDNENNTQNGTTNTENSSRSRPASKGAVAASDEMSLAESDGEREGSDHEAEPGGDNAPPSKKKKGQRFYCTDFPPCNLSFTRSEHLARHIRKHTGERPFQCHCSRRFSRLDNLRQHAQTVHVNEEIPVDSLAATGTRFQRQIRTDRVRPQGRARSGTTGSQGAHSRGHSRNLSASSITSNTSAYSQPQEIRRRPPPLIMANDGSARARLALDKMADAPSTPPGQIHGMPGPTVGSPYTQSNLFSAGGGSPHVPSPMPAVAHASGFWDGKTAARRLSVPTGTNPFMQQNVTVYPGYVNSATPTAYSNSGSAFASPVSSTYSVPRDESMYGTDMELRRRTWHPSTYSGYPRPATSGLSNYQTPEMLQPSFGANESADQPPRLPGIESFDKVVSQHRPLTPPVRRSSPMQIDSPSRPPPGHAFGGGFNYSRPAVRPPPPASGPGHRRGHVSWDMSLHTNLTGLNLRDKPPLRDASNWGQQTIAEIQNVGGNRPTAYNMQGPGPSMHTKEYRGNGGHNPYERTHGWHSSTNSVPQAARTSPEDSSSSEGVHTPSTASLEYHPAIVHNNGYIEPHNPPMSSDTPQAVCSFDR